MTKNQAQSFQTELDLFGYNFLFFIVSITKIIEIIRNNKFIKRFPKIKAIGNNKIEIRKIFSIIVDSKNRFFVLVIIFGCGGRI